MREYPTPEFTVRQNLALFSAKGSLAYNWWVAKLVVRRWWQRLVEGVPLRGLEMISAEQMQRDVRYLVGRFESAVDDLYADSGLTNEEMRAIIAEALINMKELTSRERFGRA